MKLCGNRNYPTLWFAFSDETGWVMFPAEVGGPPRREATLGLDPIRLQEVPVRLSFNAGIPGAPCGLGEAA